MNVLVPVSTSRTNGATIEAAIERLLVDEADRGPNSDPDDGTLHLVYIETPGRESSDPEAARSLLDRSAALAGRRSGGAVSVRTAHLAADRYLANPHDHAAVLAEYADEHDVDRVVLDPGYSVDATDRTLQPLEYAFDRAGLSYEHADVSWRRRPSRAEVVRFAATFLLAFGFYLAVGTPWDPFHLATGVFTGLVAGVLFRNVTFETTPSFRRAAGIVARGALFVPYLLWRILTANIQISYLVLHPSLPIDPHLDRVDAALGGGISVTGLANSLTLTPGTLTVDAERSELLVHSVTSGTRLEVLSGERERAIRFVFYGLGAADTPGPLDRDEVETVAGPTDVSELEATDEPTDTPDNTAPGEAAKYTGGDDDG